MSSAAIKTHLLPSELQDPRMILFRVGENLFMLPIGIVREVVHVADRVTNKTATSSNSIGLLEYRQKSVPVYDMLRSLKLGDDAENTTKKVIVLEFEDRLLAIKVDEVSDIVKHNEVISHPPLVNLGAEQGRVIAGVVELKSRKANALLINAKNLIESFDMGTTPESSTAAVSGDSTFAEARRESVEKKWALRFIGNNLKWCISIGQVEHILPRLNLNRFPGMPSYVLGIRQIEGEVVPIVDFSRRIEPSEQHPETRRIIVVKLGQETFGIGVEKVCDIIDLGSMQTSQPLASDLSRFFKGTFESKDGEKVHLLDLSTVVRIEG
jgi:chemotaxis signal transduction protein